VTDRVAQHRVRHQGGFNGVVRALHAELEFLRSHPDSAIERWTDCLEQILVHSAESWERTSENQRTTN